MLEILCGRKQLLFGTIIYVILKNCMKRRKYDEEIRFWTDAPASFG